MHKLVVVDVVNAGVGGDRCAIFANSNSWGPIILEHGVVGPDTLVHVCQAQRTAPHEDTCTHPGMWLNSGIATAESNTSTRASVLLDEKQKVMVSGIGGMVVDGGNEEKS